MSSDAIAERREMNGEDVESVVKILAEGFFLNRFQQVAVGGGDDADIDPHRGVAPDAFEFMRLQNVQQLGLRPREESRRSHRGRWCRRRRARSGRCAW